MEDPVIAQRQNEQIQQHSDVISNNPEEDRRQKEADSTFNSNSMQSDPASIFSDLPLSALTATSTLSSANPTTATSNLNLPSRPLSGNAASISTSSSSTSASASPSSSPNVSRSSSIGQAASIKSGGGGGTRIRPGLLSRAGTDPDRDGNNLLGNGSPSNGIRPLSSISKGMPSNLFDGNPIQSRNLSSGGGGTRDRRNVGMRSTSASEDDEARLSDSGIIPRRFADQSSPLSSTLNVSSSTSTPSVSSAPAATTSMNHHQQSQRSSTATSTYSGYSASSSRNSSPLVSPAGSISAARARQVFASPTSSPISSTNAGLPPSAAQNLISPSNSQFHNPQYYYPNEPGSAAGGHVSEASSKSGSASLGRAQSVSSVSSVNSTSSLEAAPFRAAPLGNFRVGFGGYGSRPLGGYGNPSTANNSNRRPQMMQRDKTLSGGNQIEKNASRAGMAIGTGGESSAAESEDGGNEPSSSNGEKKFAFPNRTTGSSNTQPQAQSAGIKGKQREGLPLSSSPEMPFGFDSVATSNQEPNPSNENGVPPSPISRKQAHTPKLPSDAWQYRNAPGMGGSRHNSSIPASWGLSAASSAAPSGHHRGSNSFSIPQSNTWSVGSSSGMEGSVKTIDLGNEEPLVSSVSNSQSPSRKHQNSSSLRSKIVKSASKLGIKPLTASSTTTGGSGGSSPSMNGSRPFIQLEGEALPESPGVLRIDTTASVPSIPTGTGGLLVPSIVGTPLSAGTLSSHSGDSTLGLAGLVGVVPSISSQDESLPMSRTSSVTNAPLFVAKHGEGSGANFNSGGASPLPSPGIPAYVNTSKNAFGVWAFGVPEPRVSPKEEREKLGPISSSSSNLSTSPAALRSIGALSPSSLAAIAPSSPLRTPNSALAPSSPSLLNSKALNSTPPLAAQSSPETPSTPLSRINVTSNGSTPNPSRKKSAPLTPAQQVQAEVEAGTARAPSEPSGHTPGPTPVLPPGSSSSRDRSGRNRSSHRDRERERGSSKETQDQVRKGHHHHQSSSTTSQPLSTSPIATPSTGSDPIASSFQSTSRDASKTRERQRTNSSNLRLQPIPSSDLIPFKRRDSSTPFPASAPTSPLLEASKFNLHKQSNSTSSGGSHGTEASSTATTSRGRMTSSKDVGNSPIKIPQRPSFLRALTSESVFSNKSAGGKSYRSRNDSVLSGEGSWGSGSTSKPTGRRDEDVKGPSALARESKTRGEEEEENQEGRDDDESEMPSELKSKDQDSKNPFETATNGTSRNAEPDRESFKQDLAAADSLIAERRAPIVENSINMPAAVESRTSEASNPSPTSKAQAPSSINPSPNASLSSPHGSSSSGSKSSDQPPASSFGPSEVQAKVEAQAQSEVSPTRSESFSVPPQFTRADTAISSTSNAISTSSNSIAPASIKAPVRKIPGVYIPHADSSQIGNSPGKILPLQNSDNRAHHVEGTPTSNSPSSSSSSNPSNPSPPATTSVAPSTPAPHLAPPTSSTNSQSPATPISPRTARGPKDFEFGEILGEGSYSTVLEAWDLLSGPSTTSDGSQAVQSTTAAAAAAGKTPTSSATAARAGRKIYAVKVLDKMHILKEKKQKYVNVEREALSLLVKHPGVISLYWTFQDRESLYFVLQLAQNGELLSFIKKHGSFDPLSSRYYAAQLIDTIGAMHRVGVIHRDIKPENVLLDGAMRIKVTDFGSAKISKPKSSTVSTFPAAPTPTTSEPAGAVRERANSFVGTAEYVSPELLGGKAAAEASDSWAFGCVLYQMIAGRPPFKGANEYQTFQKIIKREFEYPQDFPPDARDLVDRLLVLDPEKRLGFQGGVEEIKKHAFFSEVDFNTIWSIPAPSISTGIYQRPAPSITRRSETNSLFGSDGWADTREAGSLLSQGNSSQAASTGNAADDSRAASVSSLEQGSSSAAPGRSTTSVADADDSDSDAQAGPSRPRGLSTGEEGASGANGKRASNLLRLASAVTGKEWSATVGSKSNRNSQRASVIPPNVRQQLKHRFSFNEVNGSSSSVDDFDQDDTPTRGVPARRRHGSALAPAPASSSSPANPSSTNLTPVVGWAGLLLPHEVLLYACPVVHRKTGTANMFSKKRQLILTDFPRLLCVKETADALKVKSEVILAMPQLVPSTSQTSDVLAPLPTASQPAELFPTTPSQGTPSRFEAKRRASHSAGIDDQQAHSNDSPVSPRGIPARRESWSANSLAAERGQQASSVRGISPDPDRERARAFLRANASAAPNMLIGVEARGNRAFVVHTPARSYLYEDPSGDSSNWIKVINSARGS